MNTAEKLEYQEQLNAMVKVDQQAFARTVWDDPKKAMELHTFWKEFSHDGSEEMKHIANLEMRRLEATMRAMTDINVGFYGVQASAYIDTVGIETIDADDATIENVLPEKEVVVDAETDITKEEGGKVVSLFNGQDMGDKPNQADISKAAKELLANGKKEDAIALAKQYLGTGNYTPKKEGAKAQEWKDKAIESWIKSLVVGLSKSTPEVEKPKVESPETPDVFGTTRDTLEAETAAFKDFAERYIRLATNGSEDAVAAEDLSKLFFKGREYNDAQIQIWKETVTKNDESSVLDHFAVLGAIGTDDNKLIISDVTYEDLNAKVYDMMQEIQIAKPQLDSLKDYMVEEVSRKLHDELINTCFNSESGAVYEMYTKLHYTDFIEKVVTANFTKLDSQATTNKEVGQETGEASSSEETKVESNIEEDQKTAMEKVKEKSKLGTSIKGVTQTIIKNGGLVEDIVDHLSYNSFFGKEHKFTTREALEKHVKENFDTWKEEYLNSQISFPMGEFHRVVDTAYHSEIDFDGAMEEAKKVLVKPDGKFLKLVSKTKNMEVIFPSDKELKSYVAGIYKTNKNAEGVKEAQTDTPKTGTEDNAEEESSGEATESTVKSSSGVVVKAAHIENICNKAIKKGQNLKFILQDRKISELVEKGGSIIGPAKDAKVEYDLTAKSLDQLKTDLQLFFDNIVAKKRNPEPVVKTSTKIVDKIKQITESVKEKVEEIVESSSISSLNDVKPAGLKLIEEGGSKADLLKWGQDNLLNRKMKEQDDNAIFTTAAAVETFMNGMFSDFLKKNLKPAVVENKTIDDLKTFIIESSKEESATYVKVCKAAHTYSVENTIEIKQGSVLKFVRETATELYQTHLDKQRALREESQEKVFVPEKISETNTTVWDKVKGFKTLGEIYAISLELCDAGDWQQALNITTELIKGGNIKTTEEWTDDMITDWFNKNVLKKEVVEVEPETVEEVEDLDDNFKALQNANGGKSFRNVLIQIMSDNDDTPDLRKKIETTVRGSKANYAKKMAKAKSSVIQNKINAAKALVKK